MPSCRATSSTFRTQLAIRASRAIPSSPGRPGLRFYAGALLKTPDGHPVGTVCVLDTAPRDLTERQRHALMRLARQTMAQMELRRAERAQREERRAYAQILDSAT